MRTCLLLVVLLVNCRTPERPAITTEEPRTIDARKDISRGILALENIGCPQAITPEIADILQRKFGIKVHLMRGMTTVQMPKHNVVTQATTKVGSRRSLLKALILASSSSRLADINL